MIDSLYPVSLSFDKFEKESFSVSYVIIFLSYSTYINKVRVFIMYTDIGNYKPQLARAHIFHYGSFSTTQTSETLSVNNFHLVFTHIITGDTNLILIESNYDLSTIPLSCRLSCVLLSNESCIITYWLLLYNYIVSRIRVWSLTENSVCLMVFNTTFNNISVISWRSVVLVEETGVPGENHRPVVNHWQTLSHNVVHFVLIEIPTPNISGDRHWLHI